VTDHNEVIYHLLEATYVHLFNTRGGVDGDTSYKKETGAMEGVIPTGPANGNSELDRLEPLQKQIMLFVHSVPDTNEGVHVQTIAQAVRQPSAAVMQAVEVLSTDGLLYTTIDDDHVISPSVWTACSLLG
jgi:replication factor A2